MKENFRFPYVSKSITEFWRRWHISLGSWFREYIYYPLGGNRRGVPRTLLNLFIVFLVTGIWHGAGWNYLCWGILNGVCVVTERCIRDKKFYRNIPDIIKWIFTMLIVMISWELFRIEDLYEFINYVKIMFGSIRFESMDFTYIYYLTPKLISFILIAVAGATLLEGKKIQSLNQRLSQSKAVFLLQEVILFLLMIMAVIFMVNSTYSPFIYFQY